MPLVTGEFYEIVIAQTSAPGWIGLTTPPTIPSDLVPLIAGASPIEVFCIDAPSGTFAWARPGVLTGFVDAILASLSAPWSKLTTTSVDGTYFISGLNPAGLWRTYDPRFYILHEYTLVEQNALKAFLP